MILWLVEHLCRAQVEQQSVAKLIAMISPNVTFEAAAKLQLNK
jgi:hypothetical protein